MGELPRSATSRSAEAVAREAALAASQIILQRYRAIDAGTPIERTVKGRGNYVTETDLAAENAILSVIRAEYPGHRVLSEETSAEIEGWDSGWLWVVDPLDGTANFARGIPAFAVNIALCRDGEPVLGLTHQPVTGADFFAEKGRGLRVNGEQAHVSQAALADSLMGIGLGYEYDRAKITLTLLADLWPGVQSIQNMGSAALGLAYAASGRFDLYVHSTLYPWDIAPGIVQIREAGGLILDRTGAPITIYSEGLAGGSPLAVEQFLAVTKDKPWR